MHKISYYSSERPAAYFVLLVSTPFNLLGSGIRDACLAAFERFSSSDNIDCGMVNWKAPKDRF